MSFNALIRALIISTDVAKFFGKLSEEVSMPSYGLSSFLQYLPENLTISGFQSLILQVIV